ncbi:mucin-17-like isoform X2 [Mizuhopecten yessoensis]|uniref:mucin-17-like isoform X2 n=1 Tax=Mizuhopecten yessoensis TaxID=6573 RepID=UPI000B4597CE|nr:mucin-17-like isoform X2 [Mizuhopecten yessoensis]
MIQIESEEGNDDPGYLTTSTAVDIANKMYSTDSDLSDWETRQFGRHKITSPPLIHKNQPSDNEDNVPPESPGKRSYEKTFDTVSFEAAAENVQLSPSKKKHKEQVWTVGKENQERMPKNWNNSVSSRDSALGSSLFSAFGSVLTDSSTSFDSQSNSDDTTSSVNSSPVHSVYGRYQKIYTNDKGKNTSDKALMEYENLLLHRLPGENLGMILGIEGGKFNESISGVFVKTVTIGGAAYRATGSSKGIAVGDEILEVNGMNLKQMNRDECMTVLKEMPLRVNLMLRRGSKFSGPTSSEGVSHFRQKMKEVSSREMKVCKNQRLIQNYAMTTTTSESEDDILEGFALHHVEVDKNPDESLGISIVPSYGSTREFYQVKRLLPSGAAARSTKLKVGDRLVSCNAVSLQNLAQAKCLSILKNEAQHGDLELEVLRQTANDTPMEISVIVANGVGSKQSKVSSSKEQEIYPNSGLESESDNDVVLSGFHFNHDKSNSDRVNQMFAKNVKQQNRVPTRHPPQKYTSESNVSDQDSDYSLKSQHQKLVKAKMASNSSDPWSLALPPPAEFSDDAGLTSEAGASDTGDEHVPTTNIDDILSDYAPSISGSFRVEPYNKGLQLRDVSSGLDRSQERKRGNSLTQIQESSQELELDLSTQNGKENKSSQVKQTNFDEASLEFPDKSMNSYGYDTLREQRQVMDVFDSYLTSEDDSIMSYKQSTSHGAESVEQSNVCVTYNSQNKPRNPPSNQRANGSSRSDGDQAKYELKNVIHGDTNLGKNVVTNLNYDENIVPVQVKREMSTPPNWGKYSKFSKLPASVFDLPESSVDEEVIIPASIERENKVPIYESPMPHLDTSLPREKVPSRPKLQPRKSKSSESEESMEEIVSPIYVKKEQGSRILEEKLGTDIEETFIIPEEAKRENAWRAVQLVLMTDKWTKASKSCDGQEGEGGVLNVLSDIKSEKIETNISSTEASSVTGLSTNQLSTSVSSSGELSVIAVDNKSTSVSGELSVTAVDNKSTSVSGENVGVTVTPVNNQQKSRPVSGENIINVSVEKIHDWQSLEKNSRQKEHMITSRIEELTDENEEENVSIILEENLTKTDRGMSERNLTDPQPTHKTIVCIAEDNNVNNFVNIDCDPNQPLPHENTVTLKNAVLIDTNPCGGQSLMPQSVSVSLTSPLVSPLALTHSPTMKSGTDSTPSKSPVPRSPVPRSRKGIYPDRKSPSSPPRAASPAVMLSMDTSKESESSTTEINVTKSPSVSPKSPGSVLSPTSISSCASQMSEGDKQAKPVKKEDPPEESAPKQSTKYTTSVAVTKPSLLSTIRSQKTKTSGNMKPLSSIKPLKITTNFQPKPVKYSTTINTRPSLLSTLHGSALTTTSMAGAKSSRSEDEPFQVNVLKGILGLGMKVKVTAEGYSQVTEVQLTGPIAKDKNIRTGDYLLAINNTELTGLQDSKVQQILRLLPRGLAKIIASATPPSGDLRSSDPRRDSKELAIKPEVLDINPRSTKPKTCALLPVQTSGPKVTSGDVVTPLETTKHISSTSPGNQVTDTVEPTVSNKLQSTIITNSHKHEMAKHDVTKPASHEKLSKPASHEKLPKPASRGKLPKPVSWEELPKPASQEDLQKPASQEDLPKPASLEELPKPAPRESRIASEPVVRKEPPLIAPKSKLDKLSKPDLIAPSRPMMQSSGYVGSAAGKVRQYDRSGVTEVGSSSYSTPSSSSYVSSARKSVMPTEKAKDIDSTKPIDTVIFTSISGSKNIPPKFSHYDQEPRLIPSGHVDYVMSAKPKSHHKPSLSKKTSTGPICSKMTSPTEKNAMKVSPRQVNSVLSPRKNKDAYQFNLFTESFQIAAPTKKLTENASEFLKPILPTQPGKNDVSDKSASDIDVVTPKSSHNVHSSQKLSVEADVIDVVDKAHVITQSLVESENTVSIVNVLYSNAHNFPDITQQDSVSEKQQVGDKFAQEVIGTVACTPKSVDSVEGKTWPVLHASVEVLHEDETTKPILSDSSLPNSIFKDASFEQTDCVSVLLPPDDDSDADEVTPPLPPQSTMPGALSIAQDMLDDILSEVGEKPSSLPKVSHHLPAVPTTIAKEMLSDQIYVIQHSRELNEDYSEDISLLPPSVTPSLLSSTLPPFPSSISPMDLPELNESPIHDLSGVIPKSGGAGCGVVNEDGFSAVGQPPLLDILDEFDVNTNANLSINDNASPANCMLDSKDLLFCGVTPSPNACPNMAIDSQPQAPGSMLTDSHSQDMVNSSYESVFFLQDSPGFQGRPGDKNNLEKSSDCFRGDSVNDVGGHFVGGSPVHSNCINLSMQDNVLGSADIAFCVDNSENQRMGDNPDFQENYHDNSEDLHDYDGQSNLLSYYHQIRSESNTTDIKLLNSFDDITNSEYPNVKSRRRWSVAMGSQELNTAYIKGSVNSDITLDESIMSSENLAILLDNANDVMDRTGLSLDDEIVVVILHRPDLMMTIGVRLTVGQHQKAVVSSVDSDSLAGKDGRIVSGDVLLSANGESLTADKMDDVMDKLNKTMSSHIVLVVSKSDLLHTLVSMDTDHPYDQIVPNSRMKVKDDAVPDLGNVVQTDNKVMDEVIDKRSEVIVSKSPPKAPVSKLGLQVTDIELPPPSEITVIDPPPPEVMVIDPPPSEVKVIDPPSSEVTVIDPPTPEVTVIDTSPPEVTLIDQPPLDVTVIDQPPLNVTVIDPSPPEVMVIDQPPPEITVIDPPTPEVTVIDTSPPEVTVIDQPPLDVTVIDPPTPEVTVMDPSPPEVTTSSLIPVVPDAVKNSEVKVHLGTFSFEMPVFDDPVDDQDKEEFDVVMTKGVTGLGFLIEGGKASARGDVPLTIRRILKTGPAVKCGQLMVKDEIREINGEDITGMRHSEAWQHLKFLDDGEVRLKIWRRKRDI